jgi:N-acetylglucosaminyldiphosphoundecaprenol N-acetyl-beta-D-mannosaminyltransferase
LGDKFQKRMQRIDILGVRVDALRLDQMLEKIESAIDSGERLLIAHVNITCLNMAFELAWLRQFLNNTDLVYCDGMGVMLGARALGHTLPERLTLADWMPKLAGLAEARCFSIYLLGNPPGVAERAAVNLRAAFPNLIIAGAQHGYFEKQPHNPENEAVISEINRQQPNILLVGFGMPAQEKWLLENWSRLHVNVAITCGALFEYLAGDLRRGPRWMTGNYLEWLARLLISPRRYAVRYARDIPLFGMRVLQQRFLKAPPASE